MTVSVVEPQSLGEALDALTRLSQASQRAATSEYVFRGQRDEGWRLNTSFSRHRGSDQFVSGLDAEVLLRQFRSGQLKLDPGTAPRTKLAWLEHGRHHGLPAPLLDFSWSPFVALFFAYDGVNAAQNPSTRSVVYALNLAQLASAMLHRTFGEKLELAERQRITEEFLFHGADKLAGTFPDDDVVFVRAPSAHTRRMHAQLGVFLYSGIRVGGFNQPADFEDFLSGIDERAGALTSPGSSVPVVQKFMLPHRWAAGVFGMLEIMRITGSTMLMSPEGVAQDVINTRNYLPRAAFLRDEMEDEARAS